MRRWKNTVYRVEEPVMTPSQHLEVGHHMSATDKGGWYIFFSSKRYGDSLFRYFLACATSS